LPRLKPFLGRRPHVAKLRRIGDLQGLRAAARYEEIVLDLRGRPSDLGAPVRAEAIAALSEFYGPEVVQSLSGALGDREEGIRVAAVRGLRKTLSPLAPDALMGALVLWRDDAGDRSRDEAVAALLALEVPELPERFALALVDELNEAPSESDRAILETFLRADPRAGEAARAVAVRVAERLGRGAERRRQNAELVLGWVARQASDVLLSQLDGPARLAAVRLLGASRDSRAVEPLIAMLGDPDPAIRTGAAASLGELRHGMAVEPLVYASRDDEYDVREAAHAALDRMGVAAVVVGLAAVVRPMLEASATESAPLAELEAAGNGENGSPWAERIIGRMLEGAPETR
jgi:HEAT repeat protein